MKWSQEQKLIQKLQNMFFDLHNIKKITHPNVGLGDDTAFLEKKFLQKEIHEGAGLLLATDSLVEEIHFRWDISTPAEVAKKLIEMNASDIYCKGGTPLFALLNFSITSETLKKRMPAFLKAIKKTILTHNIIILGGDTTASRKDVFSLTLIGKSGSYFISRKNKNICVDDILVIAGSPGWSEFALDMLLSQKPISASIQKKHTVPCSQKNAPSWLFSLQALVAIDQSDSLYQSLQILSHENKIGFRVDIEKIPDIKKLKKIDANYIHHVLNGGEDFSVLAVIPAHQKKSAEKIAKIQKNFALIGKVISFQKNYPVVFFENDKAIELPSKEESFFHHFEND